MKIKLVSVDTVEREEDGVDSVVVEAENDGMIDMRERQSGGAYHELIDPEENCIEEIQLDRPDKGRQWGRKSEGDQRIDHS